MLSILVLFFIGSSVLAQEPPVVANVVNTDPRPPANGKPCRIKEAGSWQDTLHRDELFHTSCISYDDGALVELTLNRDTFRFRGGTFSETDSFYVYQDTFSNYEFSIVDGIRFQVYLIDHSQAIAESYYYYILRHGDRFYLLNAKPIATLFYDEKLGLFYSIHGMSPEPWAEPFTYRLLYALDFKKRTLSKVREETVEDVDNETQP